MNRLTFEGLFCDIAQCVGQPGNTSECPGGYCDQRRTWERLKEYEDTGLTPEQVAAQRWIPVSEKLPEDDLPRGSKVKQIKVMTALKSTSGVITVRSQMRYRMTWYSSAPWAWKCSGSEITHWMPMPKPPKEVTK